MTTHIEKPSFGREFTREPECPFCGVPVKEPKELTTRRQGEMPMGSCACGAVYAVDATGHNLGAAFIEALVFACNMDWDLAWGLLPEEDYLEKIVEHYDPLNHLIIPIGYYDGRRVAGALYFVRLHRDVQEATEQGVKRKLARATPVARPEPLKQTTERKFDRKEIERMVYGYQAGPILHAAGQDRRIIKDLQRLLYTSDELSRRRTADIIGKVTAVIAQGEPGAVSGLLQRLLNSVVAPGTSGWGAIDAIGEIIAVSPDLYAGYLPMLYQLLEDEQMRPAVIRAMARTAETRPDLIKKMIFRFIEYIWDKNPETRGNAAWLLGNLGLPEAKDALENLKNDKETFRFYRNGNIETLTVGQLATEALSKVAPNN